MPSRTWSAMLDDAIRLVADLDETDEQNYVRGARLKGRPGPSPRRHERPVRPLGISFGSRPGTYGAGILQVIEGRQLARRQRPGRGLHPVGRLHLRPGPRWCQARAEDLRTNYKRIAVAAKNIDTREHDIADSDDYFQFHGGMVATIRALTGKAPRAYVGDSTTPDAVRTRSLQEETTRVFRARVVNPRWIAAMQRHGYKGAFELAATVDYLYGFDATAGVVHDWMYDTLAKEYVLDETNQEFMRNANPWALRGIVERLHEVVERGLWENPDPDVLAQMQAVYLEFEGDLEDRHE